MSHTDRERWNKKYASKGDSPGEVPAVLLQNLSYFQTGSVLDIASGDGAIALYLASQQRFNVSALDISEIGLQRLSAFADQRNLSITTLCVDLDEQQDWSHLGSFDNICLFRYKPTLDLLKRLAAHLNEGGRLIVSTFNQLHHQHTGFNQQFCLKPDELIGVANQGLSLLSYQSNQQTPFCDSYVFEKNVAK